MATTNKKSTSKARVGKAPVGKAVLKDMNVKGTKQVKGGAATTPLQRWR